MLRSKGGVEGDVFDIDNPLGRLVYFLVPFEEDTISIGKIKKIPGRAVDLAYASTFLITESGMGYGVNALCLTFFPVAKLKNL
jgi:hypothetical protein